MLFYLKGAIDDTYMKQIVDLVQFMFRQFSKIIPGGLLIYHGLISAVEERIELHFETIMENLFTAMSFNFDLTDEYSMRQACGMVSDIANNIMDKVLTKSETLIPILRNIL